MFVQVHQDVVSGACDTAQEASDFMLISEHASVVFLSKSLSQLANMLVPVYNLETVNGKSYVNKFVPKMELVGATVRFFWHKEGTAAVSFADARRLEKDETTLEAVYEGAK